MRRATLIAGGMGCLVLVALLLERPCAGTREEFTAPRPLRPTDAGTKSPLAQSDSPAAAPTDPAPETVSVRDLGLNALTQVEFVPFDQAAPVIARELRSPDREVRLRAVNLLAGSRDHAAILPLLAVAQADADAEVRRDALAALAGSPLQENLTPFLLRGAVDMDADVREALVQTAWSLAPAQRDDFIAQSLDSSRPEIASAAFEMLAHESSTRTVALLLNVYATSDAARIQQANEVMSRLVGETFDTAAQATAWWRDHRAAYNDDLSSKTDDAVANP